MTVGPPSRIPSDTVMRALLSAVVAFALGALGGWGGRSALDRTPLPEPRRRAPALREVLDAHERGEADRLPDAFRRAADAGLGPEDEAELQLLRALARQDLRALLVVVRDHRSTPAAARAAWEAIVRTPNEDLRRRRESDFRRRFPAAWVLTGRTP